MGKGMDSFKALDTFRTGVILPSYRWELSSGEKTCLGSYNKSLVHTWKTQEPGGWGVGGDLPRCHMPGSDCPAGLLPLSSPAPP